MDGAIDHRRRRAAAEEFVEEKLGDLRAMAGISKFLFLDEGVVLQPIEQLRAIGADHLSLGIVDMPVNETTHDD